MTMGRAKASTHPLRSRLCCVMRGRVGQIAASSAVTVALFAACGPHNLPESSSPVTAEGRSIPEPAKRTIACCVGAVTNPSPPAANDPCRAERRSFQRYLATLPRLMP
jgi:hypothetical protein